VASFTSKLSDTVSSEIGKVRARGAAAGRRAGRAPVVGPAAAGLLARRAPRETDNINFGMLLNVK
jgi:hypothetical protein